MADNTQEPQVSPIQSGMETVKHLAPPPPKKMKTAADWVRDLRMNADVNKTTVGVETDRVTPDLMLATSSKLLGISRRQVEPDPKDSLEFQRIYGPAEYFSEHILRDAGRLGRQLLWKATNRGNVDFMSTGALDQHVSDVFNSSKLANMIDGSSPLETVDASFKVTRIGEGGVGDISSAPDEMRLVQPSFLGYIDSVRSPECMTARHEVLTINGWKSVADVTTGDSVACLVNGKLEWHKPERTVSYMYEGIIHAYDDGNLAYELTPDHRAWCDTGHGYTFIAAGELHGREAMFQTLGKNGAMDTPGSIKLLPLFYKTFFYHDNVYCLTVPGGIFYTRIRNHAAFWTGNSLKVGLDAYMTKHCMKGSDGKLYQEFINARTGKKELIDSVTAAKSVITTPDMMKAKTNHIYAVGGKTGVRIVKKSDVDYYLPNMDEAFSAAANLVTNMSGVKEMRLLMGCLHPLTTLVTVGKKNDVDIIYAKDASTSCNDIPGVDAEHRAKDYKIRTTVAKFPRNRAWFRKIVLCSGRVLITSKDHRWPVLRDGHTVLVDADGLKPDDKVLRSTFKDLPSRRTFLNETQVTPDVAELLGFIARSGRMVEDRLRIAYDKAHRQVLETAISRLKLEDVKFYVNGTDDCLGISDGWFIDWVNRNMGFGSQSRIPSVILSARPNVSIHFLNAYTADQTLVGEDALEYTWILDIPSVRQRDGLALLWARMGTDTYYRDSYQGDGRTVMALKLTEFINPVGDCVVDIVKANLPSPSAPIMIDIDIDDNLYATANGVVTHNSKYPLQAVSIEGREPPLVRNLDMRSGSDIHSKIGRYLGARYASKPGVVTAVRKDRIDVLYDDGTKGHVAMYDNFPMNAKGYLTNTPQVKAGDKFKSGDLLASSNYTDDKGTMATGTNLRVGWLSWHGGTYEDAVVLSESAAKKLTSTTMYSTDLDLDKTVALGKKNYQSWKPDEFTAEQLSILDDEGIVKPGSILQKGDPMVLAVRTTEPSPGTMGKRILTDISETWQHDHPGKVTDIVRTRNGVRVLTTVTAPVEVGDKVSGLHGNKGVCSRIVPDDQMPHDKDGKPLEMLLSPLGLISRTNAGQLNETLLGKIAHKTGKPETLNPFYEGDIHEDILAKLKQNGLNADDDFFDPETGRRIPGVVNGYSYIHKLKHLSESKESARGTDEYACYSADTEVLTDRGWIAWPDVTEGMRLYTYDHVTHTAWFEKPSSLYKYEYNGQLVALAGQHCDMLVTPNHNMFIAKYSKNPEAKHKFFKAQACDVAKLNRFRMLRAGAPVADEAGYGLAMLTIPGVDYTKNRIRHVYGAESFDCEAFAALLGWILSDGSITQEGKDHSNRVTIYQKADRRAELDSIEQCLRACGKAVTFTDNKEGIRRYVFNDPVLVRWLRKECGCSSVTWRIPEFVFASSATRNAFYGTYMLGDGSSSTGNNVITTVSPQMAEDLTRLLALMGSSSSKTVVTRVRQIREDSAWKYPFNYPIYTVIEHNSPAISFNLKDPRYKLNDIRFVNYSGPVYCATVSTGLLLVRRNGKMCICGNSDETPGGSGYSGAKRFGTLEQSAMAGHAAFDNLLDNKLIRGQQNSEFWRSIRTGGIPTIPGEPLVQKKFFAHLQGSGVNVRKTPKGISVFALSNSDIDELAGPREVKSRDTYEARTFRPIDGGLFGQDVFGQNGDRWGYIQLDEPVPNPVMEEPLARLLRMSDKDFGKVVTGQAEVNGIRGPVQMREALAKVDLEREAKQAMEEFKNAPASKKDAALKRYTAVEEMRRAGLNPAEYMLDKIPVLPAQFRPVSSHNGLTMVADANYLYAQLLDARDDMRDAKALPQEYQDKARENLYRTWQELVGLYDPEDIKLRNKNVSGLLKWALGSSPKFSAFQRKVLGGSVDTVGRGAIIPNAKLTIDQIGIPIGMAFDVMAPFVERGLVKRGYTPVDAMKMVKNRDKRAEDVLQEVVKAHPVEMNRAPTLHKFNIMAFEPVLVQGHAIQVHPSVCPGFGADFDGNCVDFDTEIILNLSKSLDKTSLWHDIMSVAQEVPGNNGILKRGTDMRLSKESEIQALMEGQHVSMRIGDFPRVGEPIKDRNGADVYGVPSGIHVLSCDPVTGKAEWQEISAFTHETNCHTVKVTLGSRTVIVSDNESMAVFDSDLGRLVKVKPSTDEKRLVPVLKQDPMEFGDQWDRETGWLIGAFLSDGWYTDRIVGYAKLEQCKRDEFVRIMRRLHDNFTVHEYSDTQGEHKLGNSVKLHLCSKSLAAYMAGWKLVDEQAKTMEGGRTALHKRIPSAMMRSGSEDFLWGLLSGLLDGDGSVVKNMATGRPRYGCRISTSSPSLRDSIGNLLYFLGIRYSITTTPPRNHSNEAYTICLSSVDMRNNIDKVVCVGVREKALLAEWAAADDNADTTDVVPLSAQEAEILKTVASAKGRTKDLYSITHRSGHNGVLRGARCIFMRHIDLIKDIAPTLYERVMNTNTIWMTMDKVEDAGYRDVFDFKVDGTKVYAANNGIIVWDTVNVHVPVSDNARREAMEKMRPSRNLMAPSNRKIMYKPEKEYMQGLYIATRLGKETGRPVIFRTVQEAKEAYRSGAIDIDTPIRIMEQK